jgi:hypothetical protein
MLLPPGESLTSRIADSFSMGKQLALPGSDCLGPESPQAFAQT